MIDQELVKLGRTCNDFTAVVGHAWPLEIVRFSGVSGSVPKLLKNAGRCFGRWGYHSCLALTDLWPYVAAYTAAHIDHPKVLSFDTSRHPGKRLESQLA